MTGPVHNRTEALVELERGMGVLASRAESGLVEFGSALRESLASALGELARRERALAEAQAALAAADEDSRAELERAVRIAAERVEAAKAVVRTIEREDDQFRAYSRSYVRSARESVAQARSTLRRLGADIDTYNRGVSALGAPREVGAMAGAGGRPTGGGAAAASGTGGLAGLMAVLGARGLELVDVRTLPRYPGGPSSNGHERAASDYRWAVSKWSDVIMPGIAAGRTRDDFAAMDAASGAPADRQLARVFDAMLGGDPIHVSIDGDGRPSVSGGNHRVHHAQQLGVRMVPARVHRLAR